MVLCSDVIIIYVLCPIPRSRIDWVCSRTLLGPGNDDGSIFAPRSDQYPGSDSTMHGRSQSYLPWIRIMTNDAQSLAFVLDSSGRSPSFDRDSRFDTHRGGTLLRCRTRIIYAVCFVPRSRIRIDLVCSRTQLRCDDGSIFGPRSDQCPGSDSTMQGRSQSYLP